MIINETLKPYMCKPIIKAFNISNSGKFPKFWRSSHIFEEMDLSFQHINEVIIWIL